MSDKGLQRKTTEVWVKLPDGSTDTVYRIDEFHGVERVGPPRYEDRRGNALQHPARGILVTHAGLDATIIEKPNEENT